MDIKSDIVLKRNHHMDNNDQVCSVSLLVMILDDQHDEELLPRPHWQQHCREVQKQHSSVSGMLHPCLSMPVDYAGLLHQL